MRKFKKTHRKYRFDVPRLPVFPVIEIGIWVHGALFDHGYREVTQFTDPLDRQPVVCHLSLFLEKKRNKGGARDEGVKARREVRDQQVRARARVCVWMNLRETEGGRLRKVMNEYTVLLRFK